MSRGENYQIELISSLRADPSLAAEYLNAALEDGNPDIFLLALRNVAKAYGGITRLSEACHLNRENLYRIFSKEGNPEWDSLVKILKALGLNLKVARIKPKFKSVFGIIKNKHSPDELIEMLRGPVE